MLTVISPAKKLDMSATDLAPTLPDFQEDANLLAKSASRLSAKKLGALMSISDSLAKLNYDRFKAFAPASTPDNSKPAALCFAGDTYTGLEAKTLDADEMAYAQDHLRILSGLYGLLKPRDAIQPYRLEMGSRLKTGRKNTLYDYWGDKIALKLNEDAEAQGTDTLVNCASQEYFGAVDLNALNLTVVTPTFLEDKPGGPKIVSFFAKQARGAMARFIVQNRVTSADGLQDFDTGGYSYQPDQSTPENPVFFRSEAALNAFREAS
ncbi:peroxide stress protein YaaA [uncultured Litoreibacter sp.]|uniref:peroxide stress protein YaaA n=1 Tax=uncultured Litoreibacter sp. TaxID=1392394 RepID=UPI00261B2148|nr:peroxide stress protein YaaA [uncultured Litoreibacter sp.]